MVRAALAVTLALITQPKTTLHIYSPWHGSIPARGVVVDRTLHGACSEGSLVLARADAWRCRVGSGRAYDPCFANDRGQAGAHVLCASSPWDDAVAIELTRTLPYGRAHPNHDPRRGPPWAVVTAADEQCLRVQGLGSVADERVTYACAGSAVLLGAATRGVTWTQAYAASTMATVTRRVALRQAWW